MKRVNNLFLEIVNIDNLILAFHKAKKGCSNKTYVKEYSENLFNNICALKQNLILGTFEFGEYKYFEIFEPKKRIISVAPFDNRIVHHAIINISKDYFERHFIFDTYANRQGKGTLAAVYRAKEYVKKYTYVAKLDIRKYFDSISHIILKKKIRHLFKDKRLLILLDKIIDSYCCQENFGLPIGNLTSQYFANYYLSFCDHYVKEILRVPGFVRYMDDMLLFSDSIIDIKEYVRTVSEFLIKELNLNIKPPQICNTINGVSFLGYRLYKNRILLNSRNKRRFKHRFFKYNSLYLNGFWSDIEYQNRFNALMAYIKKADTFGLRSMYCNRLYSDGH